MQRAEQKEGPLAPKDLAPKSQDDIEWFLIGQYLFRGDYDPELTKWVFTAFHAPMPYLRFEPGTADLAPYTTTPFAVGVRDGRVVLACWDRLMRHTIGREVFSRARRHIPMGLTDAEQEGALGLTPSEDMRLRPGSWRLIAIGVKSRRPSESWDAWSGPVPADWRSRIATALSSARRIYFSLDPYSSLEGRTMAPTGYAAAGRPPWRIEFDSPMPIEVIPVEQWDPYYYLEGREGMHRDHLREPQPRAVPGRTQALSVKLERRHVDQAVILPQRAYPDTAQVYVRISDTKQWLNAGIVPLKYP
jgi:hypothetical protein